MLSKASHMSGNASCVAGQENMRPRCWIKMSSLLRRRPCRRYYQLLVPEVIVAVVATVAMFHLLCSIALQSWIRAVVQRSVWPKPTLTFGPLMTNVCQTTGCAATDDVCELFSESKNKNTYHSEPVDPTPFLSQLTRRLPLSSWWVDR